MISKYLAKCLVKSANETSYEQAYYEYIIGAIVFNLQELLLILASGLILKMTLEALVGIIAFSIFRIYIKGIHLKSKLKCVVASSLVILSGAFIGHKISILCEVIYVFLVVILLHFVKIRKERKK